MSTVGMMVELPPGGETPPHRHGGASVSAYIIKGSVLNKMNDGPLKLTTEGGSWHEAPGCHHKVGANGSKTEPAVFFVNFVIDTERLKNDPGVLFQIDEEYRELVAKKMQEEQQ